MATGIEWTDETWNPTVGCSRVSPGCDNCYAEGVAARGMQEAHRGLTLNGKWTAEVRLLRDRLETPLRWKKPRRVFVDSMSDLFHKDVPPQFQLDVWQVMAATPQHTYQILTKRPQAMASFSRRLGWSTELDIAYLGPIDPITIQGWPHGTDWDNYVEDPLPNVWLGTSIESDRYVFRADHLRQTPAAVRFLSLEPLLGPLPSLDLTGIDWVIVGGESGPHARPMHPDWARDVRDRCIAAGIPFLFKQWGGWVPLGPTFPEARQHPLWRDTHSIIEAWHRGPCEIMAKVGKHAAGRELDGRTWDDYPA